MSDKAKARHPVRAAGARRCPARGWSARSTRTREISVTLVLRRRAGGEIGAHLSGAARQPLTREQFAETLGAALDDVAAVEAFAHEHGLNVDAAEPAERRVVLSGTVAAISQTFGVPPRLLGAPGRQVPRRVGTCTSRTTSRRSWRRCSAWTTGRRHARSSATRRAGSRRTPRPPGASPPSSSRSCTTSRAVHGRGPDRRHHRARRRLSRRRPQDLLPAHRHKPASVVCGRRGRRRQRAPGRTAPTARSMLDIEVVGAVAPGARIAVYFAPNTDRGFLRRDRQAVHDGGASRRSSRSSWGRPGGGRRRRIAPWNRPSRTRPPWA